MRSSASWLVAMTWSVAVASLVGCGSGSGGNPGGSGGIADTGGTGGAPVGGSAGRGADAAGGGAGGSSGAGPDSGVIRSDGATTNPPGGSIDECFAGLPRAVGFQQVDSKASADGKVRLRLALDTEDRGGLGAAWALIRFAIEVDGVVTCVKDRQQLSYTPSHHNCLDKGSVTAGNVRYDLTSPNFVATQISASMNGVRSWGPTTVESTACTSSPMPKCLRGGPCQ